MKKTDRPNIVINGDNNKVTINETGSHLFSIASAVFIVIALLSVLIISPFCPDLLADFTRWLISIAIY